MKSNSSPRRIRPLRAKAAVAPHSSLEDYELEPNMKLSHAFLIVLALHVIAVGGLFAFNKVKAHQALSSIKIKTENNLESASEGASGVASLKAQGVEKSATSSSVSGATAAAPLHATTSSSPVSAVPVTAASPVVTAPVSSTGGPATPPPTPSTPPTSVAPPAVTSQPVEAASSTAEATPVTAVTEYTVVKGDNPYNIAKRFHVSYDSLMKLNNITDPRKIQIGQKLQIPAPSPTAFHKASTTASHHPSAVTPHKVAKKKLKKKS